jgi:hypothetical protein
MAARRLLIVMLVLLAVSTLAAALVPPRAFREDTESSPTGTEATETATEPAPAPAPSGQEVQARIFVGGPKIPVVPVALGDQLALTVCSREAIDLIEIPLVGRVDPISPGVPVHFNLLLESQGSYALRFVERDAVVARIEVGPRQPAAPEGPASAAKTGCPAPAPR